MTLAASTRLGSHEIVAPIGSGGMGEVYQARDTKVGRDVAIKVLPEAFAHDPERLSRFQREAKMLASLNPAFFDAESQRAIAGDNANQHRAELVRRVEAESSHRKK
jgi:serine/threonine protein kinase